MKIRVFVDGQAGTTGLEIRDRLAQRADVELISIEAEKRKDTAARAACLNAAEVVFLCLPDAAARESAALITNPHTCVIDGSSAHRVDPVWAYGLPELGPEYRERIRTSKRVSNPGCHATAFALAIRPLVLRHLMPADIPLACFSVTGYSGGGKAMIARYETNPPPALRSPRPYALGLTHKHLPEMRVHAGLTVEPIFSPVIANYYKGLSVTVPVSLVRLPGKPSPATVHAALAEAYAGAKFVRVLPLGDESTCDEGHFDLQACNGTNRADIAVFGRAEQIVLMVRLDNLGKGAAGAAIQSMNLHLGLDEAIGLAG